MFVLKLFYELLLLAILAGGVYVGIKKGFISIMAKPVKFFASILLAFGICNGFAKVFVTPVIDAPITNYIAGFLRDNCPTLTAATAAEELPTLLKIAAAIMGIDVKAIQATADTDFITAAVGELASPAIHIVAVVISFVIVYFIGRLLFTLAFYLINRFCKGGIVGNVNKTLGIIFSFSLAFMVAWAVAGFSEFIFNTPVFASTAMVDYNGWILYRFFNSFSPIELLLSF